MALLSAKHELYLSRWYRVEGYSFLDTYAGGDSKGGSNSGEYGDEDVEHFAPKRFVFHDFLVDS